MSEELTLDGFDLGAALGIEPEPEKETNPLASQGSIKVSHRMGARQLWRKAASEKALEAAMPWHFREGDCYHCFSFGDVDSFTFFKMVLRQQPIKYAAISTWCMAGEDVKDLRKWHERGLVGRVDFFLGEIFKSGYPDVYREVQEFLPECGGRLVIFRNHSKVMAIEGERFDCLIESSANINTNPRSENTVVTVDRELTGEYIQLFSEIVPFNKDYGAEPYQRGGTT
ncbi:MAG: hypothetical protein NC489_35825 [Ruminococcus flavefaciens]|nr:hypothetical protein [Ruminococcus flavefaciens]